MEMEERDGDERAAAPLALRFAHLFRASCDCHRAVPYSREMEGLRHDNGSAGADIYRVLVGQALG